MDKHLAQQAALGASAAVATWRRVARSPAFVGLFLAVLIVLLALPRLAGPSWWALANPFDLRESEGNTLQWEHIIIFNAFHATLQADAAPAATRSYDSNNYRALLINYLSAIFAYWLDSSFASYALMDLIGWWLAAWTLYYLARHLDVDKSSSLIAAVLLAASPLLVSKMWNHGLNVAHFSSLVPCFFASMLLFSNNKLHFIYRTLLLACILYVASITYQYQWIIVPCLLSLAIVEQRRVIWILSIIIAVFLFVVVTILTYQTLGVVGISVQPALNDPLALVRARLMLAVGGDVSTSMRSFLVPVGLTDLVELLIRSYHPFVIVLSGLGLIFAHTRLRILVVTGTMLGIATSYFNPVSWVAMNGYPFMYISAGLALVQGPRWLTATLAGFGSSRWPQAAARIATGSEVLARSITVVLILLAVWSTNGDLFGDYDFAQQWWGFYYLPW